MSRREPEAAPAPGRRLRGALLAMSMISTTLVLTASPILPTPVAEAATFPSGIQTGFQIDGNKTSGTPPDTFDWDDILKPPPTDTQTPSFVPTAPYTTAGGMGSSGIIIGGFTWDDGTFEACDGRQDQTANSGSASADTNPWVPSPANVQDKNNLCSAGYGVEALTDQSGERHFILYGYFTRRSGGTSEASTFTLFEGSSPGRCDDLMLDVAWPGGATQFLEWTPSAGDGCANPDGPGTWGSSGRQIDFVFATGARTEGPGVGGNQQNTFAEYAIDLTSAGVFGDEDCSTYQVSTLLSRASTSLTSNLADMLATDLEVANCGTLTVTKATPGPTEDEFEFTILNGSSQGIVIPPGQTSLVDTIQPGETKTYTEVLSSRLLTLQETGVTPPWELQQAECSYFDRAGVRQTVDVTNPTTPFVLQAGGRTDCVITNDAALVTVTKRTVPEWSEQAFDFTIGTEHTATLADGERASFAVPSGVPLTITEATPDGWMPPAFSCTDSTAGTGSSATVTPVLGVNIECVFTNTQQATITIEKRVPADSGGAPFGFSGDLGDFVLTPTEPSGTFVMDSQQFVVAPGTYSVSEAVPDGYVLGGLTCVDPPYDLETVLPTEPPTATIQARPGSDLTCAFEDFAVPTAATLIVAKATTPMVEWDTDFAFTVTGGSDITTGLPVDDSFTLNTAGDWSWVRQELAPGRYTVAEGAIPGWVLTGATCADDAGIPVAVEPGAGSVSLDLAAGDVITCRFTNAATLATASVTKTTGNIGPSYPWSFAVSLAPAPGDARTLSGIGPSSASTTWTDLVPGHTYVLREAGQPGWDQGAITCTGGTDLDTLPDSVTFVAQVGQQLACAMTNTGQASTFLARKITAGVADDYPWSFLAQILPAPAGTTNPVTVSGVGQSASTTTFANLVPGQVYEVTELDLPDFVTQVLDHCTAPVEWIAPGFRFTAPFGGTVSCDVTNLLSPLPATMTKTVDPGDGDGNFVFDLVAIGSGEDPDPTTVSTVGGTGTANLPALIPGQRYALSERPQVGWIEGPITCTVTPDAGTPYVIPDLSDFLVLERGSIACSAHNELAPATIAFSKTTAGIPFDFDWSFNVELTPPDGITLADPVQTVSGTGPGSSDIAWTDLDPGVYTLTELVPEGWDAGAITCGALGVGFHIGLQITIEPGVSYGCTATNTALPASLTVQKRPAGIGPAFAWAFAASIAPAPVGQPATGSLAGTGPGLGAATHTWHSLQPGAVYTISEAVPTGWTLDSISCDDSRIDGSPRPPNQVVPQPGQTITCIVDNAAAPVTGTITKAAIGGDRAFPFVLDTVPPSGTPTTVTVTTTDGSGTAPLPTLLPSTRYSLTEPAVDGWEQTSPLACTRTPLGGGAAVPITDLADFTVTIGDTVACTAENRALGRVILFKEVHGTGTDPRDFGFTSNVPGHESFTVEDVVDDGNLVETVIEDVVPGEGYFFEEESDPGDPPTVLADLACTYGGADHPGTIDDLLARRMTFSVLPGETTECYFTNAVEGSIILIKRSIPANFDQDFAFTIDGPDLAGVDESFIINSDPNVAGAIRSWSNLVPGQYVLTEGTLPPNWSLNTDGDATSCNTADGWTLDLSERSITIDLAADDVVTCFFSNRADTGTVTVTKRADGLAPGTAWQFPVTISPTTGLSPAGAQQASGTAPGTGAVTWSGLVPGVTYTLTEPATAGYSSAWDCGLPDANATQPGFQFVAAPGIAVGCSLVNTAAPAAVSLTKTVSGVGAAHAWSFELNLSPAASPTGTQVVSGTGNLSSVPASWTGLVPGQTYTLTETAQAGWARGIIQCPGLTNQSPTPNASFVFVAQPGQSVQCGISNAGIASTATIAKQVTGVATGVSWSFPVTISPGVAGAASRNLTGTGPSTSAPTTWTALVPGITYTITEAVPAGWTFGGITCSGVPTTPVAGGVSFVAPLNTSISCVATNAAQPASVSVTKSVTGVAPGLAWAFDLVLSSAVTPATSEQIAGTGGAASTPVVFTDLVPGELYTLSETVPAGWTSDGPTCTGVTDLDTSEPGIQFRAGVAQAISCTILNTAEPASLSFTKTVAGVDDGYDWTFPVALDPPAAGTGTQPVSGTGNAAGAPAEWADLIPGQTYTLTEQAAGFSAGPLTCSIGTSVIEGGVAFVPAPGDAISCSVTNTAQPADVTVAKTVQGVAPDHPWSVDLTLDPAEGPPATQTAVGTGETTSDPVTWSGLVPGRSYTITEDAPGWTVNGFSCDAPDAAPTDSGVTFTAPPGTSVSCEVLNTAVAGTGTLTKTATGDDGAFTFQLTPTGGAAQDVLVSTSGGTGTVALPPLTPGITYTLAEVPAPGWRIALPLACTVTPVGGTPSSISPSALIVDAGGAISCTATNEKLGVLIVDQSTLPPGATRAFGFTWGPDEDDRSPFTLTDGASFATPALAPGTYSVVQATAVGWPLVDLTCTGSGGEPVLVGGTATVAVAAGDTVTCRFINSRQPQLAVTKTVIEEPVPLGGGAYRIGYRITVQATGDAQQVYDLTDALRIPPGVSITDASVVSLNDAATNPTWNGVDETTLAAGVAIEPGAVHDYAVTIVVALPEDLPVAAAECGAVSDPGAVGGLANDATVLADAVVDDRADTCTSLPTTAVAAEDVEVAGADLEDDPSAQVGLLPVSGAVVIFPLVTGLLAIGAGVVLLVLRRAKRQRRTR